MKKINLGVIGTGEWGKNHVRVYSELTDVNLLKIADMNPKFLEKLNKKFSLETTSDYKEILKDKNIEAVSICTPPSIHYKIAKDFLEKGKDVLVEKPMTLNLKEAEELVKIAQENERILMVGHIFRFHPAIQKLKEKISEGKFGNIYAIYTLRIGMRTPREDCGVIFDFGVHDFDTICFLLDEHPQKINASGGSYLNSKFEDVAFINLKFRNTIANVGVSWLAPKKIRELWLIGEEKSAKVDYSLQKLDIYENFNYNSGYRYETYGDFEIISKKSKKYSEFLKAKEPLEVELEHFINCVRKREKPLSDGGVGVNAVKIAEESIESISKGKTIQVNY